MNFSFGIELRRQFGLSELETRLQSLKQPLDWPIIVGPGHAGSGNQTFGHLLRSGRTFTQSVASHSIGMRIQDCPLASSGSPIIEKSVQAGDAHKMGLYLDIAESGEGVSPREASSIQRESQLEKGVKSSRLSLLNDGNLLSESAKSLQYEGWDIRSQSSI